MKRRTLDRSADDRHADRRRAFSGAMDGGLVYWIGLVYFVQLGDNALATIRGVRKKLKESERRTAALRLLTEAGELAHVVNLVGPEALSPNQRWILESAALIREGVLQQSALVATDSFCSPAKQFVLLDLMLAIHRPRLRLLTLGVSVQQLLNMQLMEQAKRLKSQYGNDQIEALGCFAQSVAMRSIGFWKIIPSRPMRRRRVRSTCDDWKGVSHGERGTGRIALHEGGARHRSWRARAGARSPKPSTQWTSDPYLQRSGSCSSHRKYGQSQPGYHLGRIPVRAVPDCAGP